MQNQLHGVIPVKKPAGPSSYDIIRTIKKKINIKKVGHAGTLDPFAEGLLLILLGEATKLQSYFMFSEKTYIAELSLGAETDSCDNTGNIIATGNPDITFDKQYIQEMVNTSFTGNITQIPPIYSAVKINGKRAYTHAREGSNPDIPERNVNIKYIDILSFTNNKIKFKTTCESGTYIRSLGRDIARKLGTMGHLTYLSRTQSNVLSLTNALLVEKVDHTHIIDPGTLVKPNHILTMPDNLDVIKLKNGEFSDIIPLCKPDSYTTFTDHNDHTLLIFHTVKNKTKLVYNILKFT
jgi:tRNA pseudouridine55 synthase